MHLVQSIRFIKLTVSGVSFVDSKISNCQGYINFMAGIYTFSFLPVATHYSIMNLRLASSYERLFLANLFAQRILLLSSVARAFPDERLAHPGSQREEENEKSLSKSRKN